MQEFFRGTMRAVSQYSPGGELIVNEVDIPIPGRGEVLVKMAYSPINPSDLSQLKGTFTPRPSYPFIPGIEGSGIVVSAGKGVLPGLRKGKMVACSPLRGRGGTWSEYMVTDAAKCIPLRRATSLETGSMLIVNPMSAIALIEIVKKGRHKSVVNSAASSALGLMLIELCRREKIDLINIVRRKEQVQFLQEKGARYILNSSEPDFDAKLSELATELNAKIFLDAVGGEQTGKFIRLSPAGSRIILYANLSNSSFSGDPRDILQQGKTIEGFSLPLWMSEKSLFQLIRHIGRVKSFISHETETTIKAKYSMQQVEEAIDFYSKNMTGGKVLLDFDSKIKT